VRTVPEAVLTLRELNRATPARQLVLERKRSLTRGRDRDEQGGLASG
jgi:hypothetical protein